MTDQRQDYAGIPIDALALQAHCNTRMVPILNTWLMRESTSRDYSLSDCGPDAPINDQHETLTELSPEVWAAGAAGEAAWAAAAGAAWAAALAAWAAAAGAAWAVAREAARAKQREIFISYLQPTVHPRD